MRTVALSLIVSSAIGSLVACGSSTKTDNAAKAAPTGPLCSVVSTGTAGTVLSGTLLLPSGVTRGELLIAADGTIACAATTCKATSGYSSATQIACPNGVISPGLINGHDHTEYATRAPETLPTTRYEHRNEWRTGADGATPLPQVSVTADAATIAAQELRFVLGGATSVVGSGGVGGLLRNLADYNNPSFVGGLSGKTVYFDTFPLDDTNGVILSSGCAYPQIETVANAFRDGVYAPHIAEGINLGAENEVTCTSQSSNNLITANTAVIHGVGVNANDVNVMAQAGAKLVWAPRSNISLYGDTAPVTVYKALGVTIALGTDWLPSGSMNMLRELACADSMNQKYFHSTFTDQQLFEMATINVASSMGFASQIGSLEVGKVADVTVFDGTANTAYRAVIAAGVEDVHLVLRGGTAVYGDESLIAAFSSSCTPMTVCGESRSLCNDTAPPVSLSQIEAAAAPIYPLFFCKGAEPTAEPTCVPYRDSYPDGESADDDDGDGVPNATDDCPTIFNPPRPMDGTSQSDVDHDGFGDACDAHPLDPTVH